jgi:hypothetical protein
MILKRTQETGMEEISRLLLAAEVNKLAREYLNFGRDRARRQLAGDPAIEEKLVQWEKENAYLDIIAVGRKLHDLDHDPKYAKASEYFKYSAPPGPSPD